MKHGIWFSVLLLSLGGWRSALRAQEAVWRTVTRSASPAASGLPALDLRPCPTAALGRPEALTPGENAPHRSAFSGSSSEIIATSYHSSHASSAYPLNRLAPGPGPEIIAVSAPAASLSGVKPLPVEAAESDDSEGQFAADRFPASSGMTRTGLADSVPGVLPAPASLPPPGLPSGDLLPAPGDPVPLDDVGGALGPNTAINPLQRRFYLSGEYLLWWLKPETTPPLVTTSAPADEGFLGRPTTRVLYGNSGLNSGPFSGARFRAGYWLDMWNETAVEFGGFFLGQGTSNFTASSSQYPVISRPFFAQNLNQEFAEEVAFPGISTGNIVVRAPTNLWGLEANVLCKLCCGCNYRFNFISGFRYLNLNEGLGITENIQGLPTAPAPFTNERITVFDNFATRNQFYGPQVGLQYWYFMGRWSVAARGSVAIGGTSQEININGGQKFVDPSGAVHLSKGGLLALPSNIGSHYRDQFSFVPEFGLNLGYFITPRVRASVGYNFLFWTNVVRPGDQIDRVLDITQIPNFPVAGTYPATAHQRPYVPFRERDLWVQGLTFGLEFFY